jgi:hypothetical protein
MKPIYYNGRAYYGVCGYAKAYWRWLLDFPLFSK